MKRWWSTAGVKPGRRRELLESQHHMNPVIAELTGCHLKLEALMAPEFALHRWNGEPLAHRSPWLDYLDHTEIREYTVRDISPRVYGEFAIVTSVCTWTGIQDGRPFNFNSILLVTCRRMAGKVAGGWPQPLLANSYRSKQVVADHADTEHVELHSKGLVRLLDIPARSSTAAGDMPRNSIEVTTSKPL